MDACDRMKNWEDLDVTKEEIEGLTECLKKDEFRKLLIQYAEDVTNPDNRKLYENELAQLERERGIDIKFINPEPGYVIKTSVNGDKKCFINISKSDIVGKPTSQPSYENGNRGLQWSIPFTLSPPRDDIDKKKNYCTVFDVVFHPDTIYLSSKNSRFRDVVNNTAFDGIENNFKVKLDRMNLKYPKMDFKGMSQSTVIRKKLDKPVENNLDIEPEIYQKLMSSYDENREKYSKQFEDKPTRPAPQTTYVNPQKNPTNETAESNYTIPKFIVKHQTNLDIQDFKNSKDSKLNATVPKNLVIVIDLPLLRSSNDAVLDVQERLLTVTSVKPAKYRLELPLSYRVDPEMGNAKFDSKKKKLTVTLPVVRELIKINDLKDDSGVDSDHGSPIIDNNIDKTDDYDENFENSSSNFISEIDSVNNEVKVTENNHEININDRSFLNSNITYSLPQFTCNIYDNTLAITVHVKNVDANTIKHKLLNNRSGIHFVFSSIGAGFFPMFYALCLKIKENIFEEDTINIEPWDNNVVFTIGLKDIRGLRNYSVGINEEFMEERDLPNVICLEKKFESLKCEDTNINKHRRIEVISEKDEIIVNIQPNHTDSDDDEIDDNYDKNEKKKNLQKGRSISESSGDELSNSNGSRCRGILKYRRNTFSRSVSESSIDDTAGLVSSIDYNYDSVQELNSESDCCSLKKTVRFNDVVSRQLYRSNSSILGRRKKNQRKLRKKKQAHERRMSESENSETEERDKYKINSKEDDENNTNNENVKPILNHDKSSNCQISNNQNEKSNDNQDNSMKTEFKNDLIFDLDM